MQAGTSPLCCPFHRHACLIVVSSGFNKVGCKLSKAWMFQDDGRRQVDSYLFVQISKSKTLLTQLMHAAVERLCIFVFNGLLRLASMSFPKLKVWKPR